MTQQPQGRRLAGRYLLLATLGKGGMATVYRARDEASGREVAVKILDGRYEPRRVERFRREGQAAAGLSHPGLLQVHSAGESDGVLFLVYELVDQAEQLDRALARMDLRDRVVMLRDVALALGYAHQRGVVHRDVKPANVLVDADGNAKVADFGLAAIRHASRLTKTGAMVGTPHYMAPEQLDSGGKDPAPTADVWSLGVILYQALTGSLPFEAPSLLELAAKIAEPHVTPPRQLADVPRDLERVCLRALERSPAGRYPDAMALAADLERWLSGAPIRRQRWPAALGVVVVAAGCVAIALSYATRSDRPDTPTPQPSTSSDPMALEPTRPPAAQAVDILALAPVERALAARRLLVEHPDLAGGPASELRDLLRQAETHPLVTLELPEAFAMQMRRLSPRRFAVMMPSATSWVEVWEGAEGTAPVRVAHIALPSQVRAVSGTADRVWGSFYTQASLWSWGADAGLVVHDSPVLPGPTRCLAPILTDSGPRVAASVGAEVYLVELDGAAELLMTCAGEVVCLESDPSQRLLAVGVVMGPQNFVELWDVASKSKLRELGLTSLAIGLAFTPSGDSLVASARAGITHVVPVRREGKVISLSNPDYSDLYDMAHAHTPRGLAVTQDGRYVFTGAKGATGEENFELIMWDLQSGALLAHRYPTREPQSLITMDELVLVGMADSEVEVWLMPRPAQSSR